MASSNPKKMSDKTEEEMQLEAELQAMTEEKKAIFQKNRPVDEALMKIGEKERQNHERLQQIRAERVGKDQRERHAARLEAQKKTGNQEAGLQADFKALQIDYDRIREQLETLSNERMAAIEELNVLRRKDSEQNEMLEKLKESLQRTTSFLRTQQKEKREKEDEIVAARQIATETQLRQLNELETLSEETRQLKQTMTTLHRQQQQQQQSTTEEHLQGKVVLPEPSTSVFVQANS